MNIMKNKKLQAFFAAIILCLCFWLFSAFFGVFNIEDDQTLRQAMREHIVPLALSLFLALLSSVAFFYATTRSSSQKEKDATAAMSIKLTFESSAAADEIMNAIQKYRMPNGVEKIAETYARAIKIALEELAKNPNLDKATELHNYATDFSRGYLTYIDKSRLAEFDDSVKAEMKLFEDKIPELVTGLKSLINSLGSSESLESITMALEMKMRAWGRIP
jgi:hypothetical protein